MFIIRGKRRDLNDSHTLGCSGRNNSKPRIGSSGQVRDTSPGQTRKKPKDLVLMSGADLLDSGTGTSVVSQRSESGQGVMGAKAGNGMLLCNFFERKKK